MCILGVRFETFTENRGSGETANTRRVFLIYRENGEYTLQITRKGIHIFDSNGNTWSERCHND